jgi:hypothetical protein
MLKTLLAFALVWACSLISFLNTGFPPIGAVLLFGAVGICVALGLVLWPRLQPIARRRHHEHLIPATPRTFRARR